MRTGEGRSIPGTPGSAVLRFGDGFDTARVRACSALNWNRNRFSLCHKAFGLQPRLQFKSRIAWSSFSSKTRWLPHLSLRKSCGSTLNRAPRFFASLKVRFTSSKFVQLADLVTAIHRWRFPEAAEWTLAYSRTLLTVHRIASRRRPK